MESETWTEKRPVFDQGLFVHNGYTTEPLGQQRSTTMSHPVSADWAAQWFILYLRRKYVQSSIPNEVSFPTFPGEQVERTTSE